MVFIGHEARRRREVTMSEHTREPWEWSWANWCGEIEGYYAYIAGDPSEDEEGTSHTGVCRVEGNATSRDVTEANARRIVACVNACRAIPTDALEHAQDQLIGPLAEALGGINAELLAAAESVLAGLNYRIDEATKNGQRVPLFQGIAALADAIAKARGAAPPA
jgi:hypothetical protein